MSKYVDINVFKAYGPVPPGVTNDDVNLQSALERAEAEIDLYCGTGYDQQVYANTLPLKAWVDSMGWLWLVARERGPVTSVTNIQTRNIASGATAWQTLNFGADIFYPGNGVAPNPPTPDSWLVRVYSASPVLFPSTYDSLMVKWSYTGGYTTIPASLQGIVLRLAWWIYKLREAPLGRVVTAELGLMEVPLSIPPDIRADLNMWRRTTQ